EIVGVMIPLVLWREAESGEIAAAAAGRIRKRLAVDADDHAVGVAEQHAHLVVGTDALLDARAPETIEEAFSPDRRDFGPGVFDEAQLDLETRRAGRGRGGRFGAVGDGAACSRGAFGTVGDGAACSGGAFGTVGDGAACSG